MPDSALPPKEAITSVDPPDDGQFVEVPGGRLFARLRGAGPVTVVIETALAGLSAEWWHLQDQIAEFARVLTYDRAGYGRSTPNTSSRTSRKCAEDLWQLLQALGVDGPYLLVGHSQGGLYIQHFARLHPDRVAALVLLDPLSHDDGRFKAELPPEVYRKSGVDKTPTLRAALLFSRLRLLRLLKPWLRKSPPFSYYRDIPAATVELIWRQMQRPSLYRTALDEYACAHTSAARTDLLQTGPFPDVPLALLWHDPVVVVEEIVRYGGLDETKARRIEQFWEEIVRGYLGLSSKSEWIACDKSSHFIHQDRPDILLETIQRLHAMVTPS